MKYDFNLENLRKIIESPTVPDAPEALEFDIEQAAISIKRKYTDADGDERGNSILIDTGEELMLFVSIEDDQYLISLYRPDEQSGFITLEATSPKEIINFSSKIWTAIIDKMEELENETYNLVSWEDFSAQFGNHGVPEDLKKLYDFEGEFGYGNFSESFCLNIIDKTGIKTWSENPEFVNSFVEFAIANGSGSSYGYWLCSDDIEKCPIVVFGDEGGIYIVAENTSQFIQLLTFDTEISVYEQAYFYRDEDDYEPSDYKDEFVEWTKENFNLKALETNEQTDEIINNAKEKYQQLLDVFLGKHGIENW